MSLLAPITPSQLKYLHALLNQLDWIDQKPALVKQYTNGRETSSKNLLKIEADDLIRDLEGQLEKPVAPTSAEEAANERMRRKIISRAHEMGWELPGGKADMARINAWCQTRGFGKKRLNDYTKAELSKLVSQMDIVYKKYLKELSK
jgi:hypothetical protein